MGVRIGVGLGGEDDSVWWEVGWGRGGCGGFSGRLARREAERGAEGEAEREAEREALLAALGLAGVFFWVRRRLPGYAKSATQQKGGVEPSEGLAR